MPPSIGHIALIDHPAIHKFSAVLMFFLALISLLGSLYYLYKWYKAYYPKKKKTKLTKFYIRYAANLAGAFVLFGLAGIWVWP